MIRRPALTAKVARGLKGVAVLVRADIEGMGDDHPWAVDDLEAAAAYVDMLWRWYERRAVATSPSEIPK